MAPPPIYYVSAYGDVPLMVIEISTARGRDVTTQSPAFGDRHPKTDRGLRDRPADVVILFCDQPGLASYTDRYDEFVRAAEQPRSQIFTHPLDGSYRAKVGPLDISADAESRRILVRCTIFPDTDFQPAFPVAAGTSTQAGVESVTASADAADAALADVGLSSSAPRDCKLELTRWDEAVDLASQDILGAAAQLTSKIDDSIRTLELLSDLEKWPAYRAMIMLRYSVVRAAQAFTSSSSSLFEVFVDRPRPLRSICAEVYGARDAEDFATKIAKLNKLRKPGLVPQGTTLKMITEGAR